MLERYETNVSRAEEVRIWVDGKEVEGRNFVWAVDGTELEEGTWDLVEWKREVEVEEEMASQFRAVED